MEEEWVGAEALGEAVGGVKDHDKLSEEVSDPISVSGFKEKCLREVYRKFSCDPLLGASREELAASMGLDEEQFTQVEETFRASDLMPPGSLDVILKLQRAELPKDSPLKSIRNPEAVKERFDRRGLYMNALLPAPTDPCVPTPGELIQAPEVLLSVQIYHPVKKRRDYGYLVFGSQLLTELRDVIICCSDYFIDTDYSEDPGAFDRATFKSPPHRSPSAFFFINNTFYNDMRHAMATDLSKPIIDWSREENRIELAPRVDTFSAANMATTRFDALTIRLGYPYLYCHHSNCEHLVIFNDLRMLHPTDSQSMKNYPKLVYQHRGRRKKCDVCNMFGPTWATQKDDLATVSPCFFCEDCFKKLHYTSEGKKICDFEAYPIFPDVIA